MGRSVDYLNNAEYVIYFSIDWIGKDENGEYNPSQADWDWDDFKLNLQSNIQSKLKSYSECERWDSNEVKIFLENELCEIALSEYCGLYSLSIRVQHDDYASYAEEAYINNLGKHHANQIRSRLEKALYNAGAELLNRIGTFSTGAGVFVKDDKYFENNM